MKANELMIGDWVMRECMLGNHGCVHDTKTVQLYKVDAITKEDLYLRNGDNGFISKYYNIELKPVPLTAEILEKNGFEELMSESEEVAAMFGRKPKPIGVWQYGFGRFDSVSYVPERSLLRVKFMEGYTADMSNIKYVHELQHALRLCGIEKEVEL